MNTNKKTKTKVLEKEPLSIWEMEAQLKTQAKTTSEIYKEVEANKIKSGYSWVQVDNRTRKLIKTSDHGRK